MSLTGLLLHAEQPHCHHHTQEEILEIPRLLPRLSAQLLSPCRLLRHQSTLHSPVLPRPRQLRTRPPSPHEASTLPLLCPSPYDIGFGLCHEPRKPKKNLVGAFSKAQAAASWILGAFRTSPRGGIEILAGILPLSIHLKIYKSSVIHFSTLPDSHILRYTALRHKQHNTSYTTGFHVRSLTKASSHLRLHLLTNARYLNTTEQIFQQLSDLTLVVASRISLPPVLPMIAILDTWTWTPKPMRPLPQLDSYQPLLLA